MILLTFSGWSDFFTNLIGTLPRGIGMNKHSCFNYFYHILLDLLPNVSIQILCLNVPKVILYNIYIWMHFAFYFILFCFVLLFCLFVCRCIFFYVDPKLMIAVPARQRFNIGSCFHLYIYPQLLLNDIWNNNTIFFLWPEGIRIKLVSLGRISLWKVAHW